MVNYSSGVRLNQAATHSAQWNKARAHNSSLQLRLKYHHAQLPCGPGTQTLSRNSLPSARWMPASRFTLLSNLCKRNSHLHLLLPPRKQATGGTAHFQCMLPIYHQAYGMRSEGFRTARRWLAEAARRYKRINNCPNNTMVQKEPAKLPRGHKQQISITFNPTAIWQPTKHTGSSLPYCPKLQRA